MYCALLRGVNTGSNKITNKALKEALSTLEMTNITPILQSGNVVFESEMSKEALKPAIESKLRDTFGCEAFVIVKDKDEMTEIFERYPFESTADMQPYVVFVANPALIDDITALPIDDSIEQVAAGTDCVYWTVVKGKTLSSPFGKILGNKQYKPEITSRNMRTLSKILNKMVDY